MEASEALPASTTRSAPLVGPFKALGNPPHGLLHQGSGVSVNSDYKLTAADLEALKVAEDCPLDLPSLATAAAARACG